MEEMEVSSQLDVTHEDVLDHARRGHGIAPNGHSR
jgi:hypothetical protein